MSEVKSQSPGTGKKKFKKPVNLRQLAAKRDVEVNFGKYQDIMGDVDGNCNIIIYGMGGGGKSVLAMQLSYELALLYGKALYNSHEEKTNRTFKKRANDFLPPFNPLVKFHTGEEYDFETLCRYIERSKYRVVVIDSVQYMRFTVEQLTEMRQRFKRRKFILIMISFGTGVGSTDGANKLLHACDVKLHVKNGKLTSHGRGLDAVVVKQLFTPAKKHKQVGQLELSNAEEHENLN